MKVKNFCKKLIGDYRVYYVDSVDKDKHKVNIYEGCSECIAERFGDEKISQFFVIDDEITLISKKSGIYLEEDFFNHIDELGD